MIHDLLFGLFGGGIALALAFGVISHWLNARDTDYSLGYAKGFKSGVEAERNRITQRSSTAPRPHGPRHPYNVGEHRSRED